MAEERNIPTPRNPDLVSFTIKVEGNVIAGTYDILQINISQSINRVPAALIVLKDGEASAETFSASSSDDFVHGNKVEILLGYHNEEELVFSGVITRQRIQIKGSGSRLYIDCRDAAYQMSLSRKSRYFEETTDSEAIEDILSEYSDLSATVEASSVSHQELVQFDASDWDFMISRADANGMFCIVDNGEVKIAPPALSAESKLKLQYGSSLLELDIEMDGRDQHEGVEGQAWDVPNQEKQSIEAEAADYEGPGNMSTGELGEKLKVKVEELRHSGHIKQEELQAWADAKRQRNQLSKVQGNARFQGTVEIKAGDFVDLSGLGDRFTGKAFVQSVSHQVREGQWWTNIQLGMDEKWFVEHFPVHSPPAANLLPAVNGLQIGIVTALQDDPEGEDRIKVRLPSVDDAAEGIWSRLSATEAGDGRGHYYRPEINDEVIVGFINDDPRQAIILGSLFSSSRPNPETAQDDNHKKGYLSRSGIKFEFDDEKSIVTLETPGGAKLIMDDDEGSLLLQDQNGNKLEMNSDGVTIESAKDINIKATGDITAEGINMDLKAQAALTAEGGATAELSGGGSTTVKGGIVQIN